MLIVKKFGGTSVANKERILNVARRCADEYKKGNDVVVVLSAMGKMTDELIEMAKNINPEPSRREMDMLLTTGEQTSVALAAMAFATLNVPAISLNAFQVAMHTTSNYSNARLKRIDTERIRTELDQKKIVIVTGFQGINNTAIIQRWAAAVPIPRLWLWQQLLRLMPVRYIPMWTAYTPLIPEWSRRHASCPRSLMMRCSIWRLLAQEFCTTVR